MEGTKNCPFCAETLQVEALICRYCRFDLRTGKPIDTEPTVSTIPSERPAEAPGRKSAGWARVVVGSFVVISAIGFCAELLTDDEPRPEKQPPKTQTPPIVFLSGVENGELMVPIINLWDLVGCKRGFVIGEVESGLPVRVLEVRKECFRTMFLVETYGANAYQRGWVSELFVRD